MSKRWFGRTRPARAFFGGIRIRLFGMILLVALPLMGAVAVDLYRERQASIEAAHAKAIDRAQRVAELYQRVVVEARTLLEVITQVPEVIASPPDACRSFLLRVSGNRGWERGIWVFGADGHLYVGSAGNNSVLRFRGPLEANSGAFIDTFVPSGSGGISWIPAAGLQIGPSGDLFVSSRDTSSVLRFSGATGALVCGLPGMQLFDSLGIDSDGNVVVATLVTGGLTVISPAGEVLDQVLLGDPMVTNVCFGGDDLRTAYATLSATGRLVSFPWPRPGLRLNY